MSNYVQRFHIHAYPSSNHSFFYEWQTASIIIFIGEDNRVLAEKMARETLKEKHWVPIEFLEKATLIEKIISQNKDVVYEAFCEAKKGTIFFQKWIDEPFIFSNKKGFPPLLSPRITEEFMDKVMEEAGGHRPRKDEINPRKSRNVDYLFDQHIVELKDLQQEGLEKKSRQIKLAKLMDEIGLSDFYQINSSNILDLPYKEFLDILGGPVNEGVRSAAHQIRQSREFLKNPQLEGIVVYINTGYFSLPHEIFCDIVEKMAKKYEKEIQHVICISNMISTNGVDTITNFYFYPHDSKVKIINDIHESFLGGVAQLMTDWAHSGFSKSTNPATITKPFSFENGGRHYRAIPNAPECSMKEK